MNKLERSTTVVNFCLNPFSGFAGDIKFNILQFNERRTTWQTIVLLSLMLMLAKKQLKDIV